jgi:hypothetical protein
MDSAENPLTEKPFALRRGTETVKVFTRHTADCPHDDPQWRRCRCRKYLYLYRDGIDRAISAKTRSWEAAAEFPVYSCARMPKLSRKAHLTSLATPH